MRKRTLFLILIALTSCLMTQILFASDWDSLGSSEAMLSKSKALDSKNKVRVVQKRSVDRDLRFEVSGHYGFIDGGDSYVKTQSGGVQLEFHINPQWSLGFRYDTYFNALTAEGNKNYTASKSAILNGNQTSLPEIDFPLNSQLATISWYPIYGKLNLFDRAITQFDIYLMAGTGRIELDSGNSSLLTAAGAGAGLWFTKHIMSRMEIRYQGYQDKVYLDQTQVNTTALHLSLGFLL